MRSTRFFSRGRTSEHGIVLVAALTLAILYFALMELLLLDSARALAEARNFRGRIVALTLAENAAELAALNLVATNVAAPRYVNDEGTMRGSLVRSPVTNEFEIIGEGQTTGLALHSARVKLKGRIEAGRVKIDFSDHGQ